MINIVKLQKVNTQKTTYIIHVLLMSTVQKCTIFILAFKNKVRRIQPLFCRPTLGAGIKTHFIILFTGF